MNTHTKSKVRIYLESGGIITQVVKDIKFITYPKRHS